MCAWVLRIIPVAKAGFLIEVFSLQIEPGHEAHTKSPALHKPEGCGTRQIKIIQTASHTTQSR